MSNSHYSIHGMVLTVKDDWELFEKYLGIKHASY